MKINNSGWQRISQMPLQLVLAFAFLLPAGPLLAAQVVTGEDGIAYTLEDPNERPGWLLGKVEPAVLAAGESNDKVNVAIYLYRSSPDRAGKDPVEQVKARYADQMDALTGQIRAIHKRYQSPTSLNEKDERAYLLMRERLLSDADRAELTGLKIALDSVRDARAKEIGAALHQAGLSHRTAMADFISGRGGEVYADVSVVNAIGATIPADMLMTLAEHPQVSAVVLDREVDLELDNSTDSAGFDDWHVAADGPYTGGAFDFGVIDSGVQEDHPGFSNVNVFYSNFAGTDLAGTGHGTHVTGIVANDSTNYIYGGPYTGAATDLDAVIWGQSGNQATTMARMDDLMTDHPQSPEVINHSLGYGIAVVDYSANDSFYDAFVDNYNILVTKSAGNQSWGVNPTMTYPSPAYNIMVVANMNDRGTLTRTDDIRSTSSSVGPTINGREKPDISAPGSSIQSTNAFHAGFGDTPLSGCSTSNNTDICTKSGTSMAAPHVAGAIVLMEDAGNNNPKAQKAVLFNTADPWESNGTSTTADDGPVAFPLCDVSGPTICDTLWDRSYGLGYIDMSEALFNRDDYFLGSVIGRNNNATPDDYKLYKGTMFANEKATVVWEKRATTYNAGLPSGGQHALGDINIRLYSNSDGDLLDWEGDAINNNEQVIATESGTAVIKVYAWSTSFAGTTSELYALATEENFTTATPPSFSAAPLIPLVGPFQTFTAPTVVSNLGQVSAHNTNVTLGNIGGVSGDGGTINVGTIADGGTQQADFTLTTSGLSSGTYIIGSTISSNSYDETYTSTDPTSVQFVVETDAPVSNCTIAVTATNGNSVNIPWSAGDGFGTGVDFARLYVVIPGNASFAYSGLAQSGSSGTFTYNFGAGDGTYRFAIRAWDNGGNAEAFPTSTECTSQRDTVDPASTLSSPTFVGAGTIPLTWSVTDPAPSSGLEFVDLWYYEDETGPWTYTGLFGTVNNGVLNWAPPGPGVYHFTSRAKDNAQNIEDGTFVLPPSDTVTNFGNVDTDGDGVRDLTDNCKLVANANQRDTNGDLIGNACDPDINNDCFVNFPDLDAYKANFFQPGNLDTDNNGDGFTNFTDLGVIQDFFFGQPGPGALGACNF